MNFLTWISRDQREVEVEIERRRSDMIQARRIQVLILELREAAVVLVARRNLTINILVVIMGKDRKSVI